MQSQDADPTSPAGLVRFAAAVMDALDTQQTELPLVQWSRVADKYLGYRDTVRAMYGKLTQRGLPDGPQ